MNYQKYKVCEGTGAFGRNFTNPRAACPVCGFSSKLTKKGRIRRHKAYAKDA